MEENCGVFGIYNQEDCSEEILFALHLLQHRGQKYCGISTSNKKEIFIHTHKGRCDTTFSRQDLEYLKGNFGIGHVSLRDRQPMRVNASLGNYSICFTGNIVNADKLMQNLKKEGHTFEFDSQLEILLKIIAKGKDFVDGIEIIDKEVIGSFCLLVLTKDGIYAVRDKFGFKPLILGKKENTFCVASESRALQNMEIDIVRDVKPGEIIFIDKNGFKTIKTIQSKRSAFCSFEWAYTASVDSVIDGMSVDKARNNMGAMLAKRDAGNLKVDIVAPVPNSGIGHAEGYHLESKIPLKSVFLLDRYGDRSYTQATQKERNSMAKNKLSVLKKAVEGKIIVLCDDSIVRGTQIREKVKDLKKAGAKEVHVRIACPPLMHPCLFDISTKEYDELIARRQKIEEIRKSIGADSLIYNTLEDFVKATKKEKNELCLYCFDGKSVFEEKRKKLAEQDNKQKKIYD